MGRLCCRQHSTYPVSVAAAFAVLVFASASATTADPTRQTSDPGDHRTRANSAATESRRSSIRETFTSGGRWREEERSPSNTVPVFNAVVTRRILVVGPGSSPPSCRSKCGRCAPCKAVHVTIQPGVTVPLEYYPEAWRCKCGSKLYMP
ncbi:hypothetical protein Nepgr_020680 [Nepenthes gracilis]|uniref:Epidermal patterning factor-like protein n=1 Tax=Nepenthes gracilis TaxID=150966 RepID=A0AAD3XWB2_NEPGR|nr:hypothetical protein Nepgr_020680 [Nepenthes gracilis]